jgi:hypothetical protein
VPPHCLGGPTEKCGCITSHKKAHSHEMREKAGSISNTCELPWPARSDMKKRLPAKPEWGRTAPRVQRCIARMYFIMAAASYWYSPAVARHRAKYDGDFRVPTLLDAQPLDENIRMAVEPEEGGKLVRGRIQSTSQCAPRRASKPSRLMEPQGFSVRAALAGTKQQLLLPQVQLPCRYCAWRVGEARAL